MQGHCTTHVQLGGPPFVRKLWHIMYLDGRHFEKGSHFGINNTRNEFYGSKYPRIHVLVDPLCQFVSEL